MANTINGFNALQALFKQKQMAPSVPMSNPKIRIQPTNSPKLQSLDLNKFIHVKRMMKKYLNKNLV